jgi:pyruvate-formate lyase
MKRNRIAVLLPRQLKNLWVCYNQSRRFDKYEPPMRRIYHFLLTLIGIKKKMILPPKQASYLVGEALQLKKILCKITYTISHRYVYPLDENILRCTSRFVTAVVSLTPDYANIVHSSLNELKQRLEKNRASDFSKSELITIDAIHCFAKKIQQSLYKDSKRTGDFRLHELAGSFEDFLDRPAQSLDEALQKILFYNALFWQNGHRHNGLGRLDKVLFPYYKSDLENERLTKAEAKKMLTNFVRTLGNNTKFKSSGLVGDTGQVILLGGISKEGEIANELTEFFLEIFSECTLPDPKLILRVNKNTPDNIWELAVKCILTGIGSPLFMNEERIIPLMCHYGYGKEDCYEFGTSACWEPLIIGKSFDQNNSVPNIVALKPLNDLILDSEHMPFLNFQSFYTQLKKELTTMILSINTELVFDKSPLLSFFFDDCLLKQKDIGEGGAKYNYHGVLTVSLPNLVNALLNIKKFVFTDKLFTLEQCRMALLNNFDGHQDMKELFANASDKFGNADGYSLNMTNELMKTIAEAVNQIKIDGNKVKVGFSSPAYIDASNNYLASMDGRSQGTPFATHISPISKDIDLSDILHFASQLDYPENGINGNVVDFVVPPAFMSKPDKLIDVLKVSIFNGIFELQLNVLNKSQLKDAKLHPEKYPDLIVRVWGFSAYFNDLPEEYKDNLIGRAELYA